MKRKVVVTTLGLMCFLSSIGSNCENVVASNISEDNVKLYSGVYTEASKVCMSEKGIGEISKSTKQNPKVKEVNPTTGYTTARLNVRSLPSLEGEILAQLEKGTKIEYFSNVGDWLEIEYNGSKAYVHKDYVSSIALKDCVNVHTTRDFKSYMSYKTIKSCSQKVLQDFAYTGTYGIRMVDGRYCVAVGTACNASVGDYGELVLENNARIPIIVSDFKATVDTQLDNLITASNGCCSEFVVDVEVLDRNAKRDGTISSCCESWKSPVVKIIIYEKNYFN